jgi:hypothetical protein
MGAGGAALNQDTVGITDSRLGDAFVAAALADNAGLVLIEDSSVPSAVNGSTGGA